MPSSDGFERRFHVGEGLHAVDLASLDQGSDAAPGAAALVVAGEQCVLTIEGKFPFILPMSARFIQFVTGGTRILVPTLRSIDLIGVAMELTWGLNGIRAFLSWLRPGFWMPRFAG